jgi:tRNA pseudouridine55 synthase
LDEFKNLPKTYVATIKLGAVSDTFDKTGTIEEYELNIKQKLNKYLTKILQKINNQQVVSVNQDYQGIRKLLDKFIGKQHQLPPMFSAKKVKGKKLYELARKGITVKRKKNKIEIFSIKLLDFQYPILKIEVTCSAGTYIRTLANDIGEKLGCGGYCEELQRIRIGDYSLTDAVEVENLKF